MVKGNDFNSEFGGDDLHRFNTMQDFFQIDQDNENMRDQIFEIQSSFTAQDQQYLELQ